MGRNHLDDQIRRKLEATKITPSEEAWSKLEAMLDEEVPSKRKNYGPFYWIAASIVIVIACGVLFFNTNDTDNTVVPHNVVNVQNEDSTSTGEPEKKISDSKTEEKVQIKKKAVAGSDNYKKQEQIKQKQDAYRSPLKDSSERIATTTEASYEHESVENRKVDEIVAKLKEMQQDGAVTDAQVNALLLAAQKELDNERILNKQTDSLKAMALLLEVETELDQSFKEKVFEALKEGFVKVRTAVAERNQ